MKWINFLSARAKEPSTYTGLGQMILGVGILSGSEALVQAAQAVTAISGEGGVTAVGVATIASGLLGGLLKERGGV